MSFCDATDVGLQFFFHDSLTRAILYTCVYNMLAHSVMQRNRECRLRNAMDYCNELWLTDQQ